MPVRQTLAASAMTGNQCVATVASGLQHLSGACGSCVEQL